jgi:glycosyltransferase involved in cell wall biosynthesis
VPADATVISPSETRPATPRISIYTFVKDGLFYDFHVVAMLRHHLPLADEIIVNEGFSGDGTFEAISAIDPKIRVFRSHWDRADPNGWHRAFKNDARARCSGDWCILLDCDEFIPEWEFARLRAFLETTDKTFVNVKFTHFYGSYRVRMDKLLPVTPSLGRRIHRNSPDVEVWGDGANVRLKEGKDEALVADEAFDVHHFGCVRNPARLRQKWRTQAKQHGARPKWDRTPGFLFNLFPHSWQDADFLGNLAPYDGPHIQAVREDPGEFVRDRFELLRMLNHRAGVS